MQRSTFIMALVVAATVALPSGVATWSSYGSQEPDNHYDADGGFMFTDPPGRDTDKVYFNVFMVQAIGGTASPSSATLGSRITAPAASAFNAILGVWVDCNGDGFVGLADGAMQEYRIEASQAAGLPVDTGLCPEMTDTADNVGKIHNANGWINELLPIAPVKAADMASNASWRYIPDLQVKIWGDFGEPVAPKVVPAGGCRDATINPPMGTHKTRGPGGILQQLDCDLSLDGAAPGQLYARVLAADSTGTVANNTQDPTGLYDSKDPAHPAPLDINVMGDDASQGSMVSGEQDCSAAPLVDLGEFDSTFSDLGQPSPENKDSWAGHGVRAPGALTLNPGGSFAATLNETNEESPDGDCDTSDDAGHDYYGNGVTEVQGGSSGGTAAVGKTNAQMNFGWGNIAARAPCGPHTAWDTAHFAAVGLYEYFVGVGNFPKDPVPGGSPAAPDAGCGTSLGLGLAEPFLIGNTDQYWSGTNWVNTFPNTGGFTRGTGTDTTVAPDGFTPDWDAFYAHISATGVSVPSVTPGTYGAEWCLDAIGAGAGIQNGWDCDPANWNLDANTGLPDDAKALEGSVGDHYQLRDVGCYDSTLVSKDASVNPTEQDIGPRSASLLVDPAHGCW